MGRRRHILFHADFFSHFILTFKALAKAGNAENGPSHGGASWLIMDFRRDGAESVGYFVSILEIFVP